MVAFGTSFQWTLVLALLVMTGFSGCFEQGKDGSDEGTRSWFEGFQRDDEKRAVPLKEYEDLYRIPDPGSCEGCIPLDVPPPEPPTPTKSGPPPIVIPFPKMDDRARIRGANGGYDPRDEVPLPRDPDGTYAGSFRVTEGGDGHARFEFGILQGAWHHAPTPTDLQVVVWNVSLESRTVTNGTGVGSTRIHGDLREEDRRVAVEIEPRLETLFWLGSHLWGRTLQAGDTFTSHWAAPGTDGEYLRFAYLVERAERDAVQAGHAAHHHRTAADAVVRVTVTDMYGGEGEWSMLVDEASPYPVSMSLHSLDMIRPGSSYVPAIAHWQEIVLQDRGVVPLDWSATAVRPARAPEPADPGFLIGERVASVALDRLPTYPLRDALGDLALLEGSFRDFVQAYPERVLIEAWYQTWPTATGLQEHRWHVVFTDRADGVKAWTVARVSHLGVLVPVAHDVGAANPGPPIDADRSGLVARLSEDRPLVVRLASGTTGMDRLAAMGVHQVDHLHYHLALEGTTQVGGTLKAYRTLIDETSGALDETARPLGYFVQDLSTRIVTESTALR